MYLLFSFVGPEMIIIAFIVLLLFGGKKLPELMKGLGKGIKEFNSAKDSIGKDIENDIAENEKSE